MRATPAPISDESDRFWGIFARKMRSVLGLGFLLSLGLISGVICSYDVDQLADPTCPLPRRESTQNDARIPKSTWVGLILVQKNLSVSCVMICVGFH